MSRGLTEEIVEQEPEYSLADVTNALYGVIVHVQRLEAKLDAVMEHMDLDPNENID